jgi:TonB-dependent receptor
LKSIVIPASVVAIGNWAFESCPGLTGVFFEGRAPGAGITIFLSSENVTVFYLPGTVGWTSTYGGRPTAVWQPGMLTTDGMFGVNAGEFGFNTTEMRRASEFDIPSLTGNGLSIADVTNTLSGFGSGLGLGPNTPTTWLRPDFNSIASQFDIYCNCTNAYGDWTLTSANAGPGNQRDVSERDLGYYVQLNWNTEIGNMPFRGDIGVRQVETETSSTGIFSGGSITVDNEYSDTLPALNMVLEVVPDFQVRFAASKAMARPSLANLSAQGAIALGPPISVSVGNPLLEPTRATTYDLGFEWYFAPEALFSIAYFYKDIEDYAQRIEQSGVPYSTTGLPDTTVSGTPITQATVVDYVTFINTDGGPLEGYEVSYQQPFTFLPGILSNFGTILNFTHVTSEIDYQISPTSATIVTEDLLSLSPNSWNATLYFENDVFSARVSASHRDAYLTPQVPGRNGNELEGKTEVTNIDASASWQFTENLAFTFEGINLTDEFNENWVGNADRSRQSTSVYTHTGSQYYFGFRYKY